MGTREENVRCPQVYRLTDYTELDKSEMENLEVKIDDSENDTESYPVIVKEGWLMKRGEHFKNWRPRYFILKDDRLWWLTSLNHLHLLSGAFIWTLLLRGCFTL